MKSTLQTVIVFLAAATIATAGTWWEKVSDISVSEDGRLANLKENLYLYDLNTVYLSNDEGNTWKDMSATFPNGVYAFRQIGANMYAFTPAGNDGRVTVFRSDNGGSNWHSISQFPVSSGKNLRDVSIEGTSLYAISDGRTIQVSWDNGKTWNERTVDARVGSLVDFASCKGLWVATGTEATMWSSDNGNTWYEIVAPIEVGGGITQVENYGGTIWAGGILGACRFDMMSRSWEVYNEGLPVFASLVGAPTTLRAIDGVLFGVFKTFNGTVRLLRLSRTDGRWVEMESAGLPPHNLARYDNFAVIEERVYLYYYGDDIGFVGVYRGTNDAPTSVDGDVLTAEVSVGPNPATDHVRVSMASLEPMTVELVSMTGQAIATVNAVGEAEVNLTAFPSGTYYVRITDARGTTSKPIVISR